MKHVNRLQEVRADRPSFVTVGAFDGLHVGHRRLITEMVAAAHTESARAVVVTFFPHPDIFIRGAEQRYYLTTPEEKRALLEEMGVDLVVTLPFDEDLRHMNTRDFVERLVDYLNMCQLWVGHNFIFGYGRRGDVESLEQMGWTYGFRVLARDLERWNGGHKVSSSRIREAVEAGEMEKAAAMLGRPYRLAGPVVRGDGRGHELGVPTANVAAWDQKILPGYGIYACEAHVLGQTYAAAVNVGIRPTFDDERPTIEAHLLDFDCDIYGETLALDFRRRLRGEMRFENVDELIAQMHKDIEQVRQHLLIPRKN